jgi:hypothetical protein
MLLVANSGIASTDAVIREFTVRLTSLRLEPSG